MVLDPLIYGASGLAGAARCGARTNKRAVCVAHAVVLVLGLLLPLESHAQKVNTVTTAPSANAGGIGGAGAAQAAGTVSSFGPVPATPAGAGAAQAAGTVTSPDILLNLNSDGSADDASATTTPDWQSNGMGGFIGTGPNQGGGWQSDGMGGLYGTGTNAGRRCTPSGAGRLSCF